MIAGIMLKGLLQVNEERIIGLDCQAVGAVATPSAPVAANLPPGIQSSRPLQQQVVSWQEQRRLELQNVIFMLKACHLVGFLQQSFSSSMQRESESH